MTRLYALAVFPYSPKARIALVEIDIEFDTQLPAGIGSGQAEGEFGQTDATQTNATADDDAPVTGKEP